MGWHCWSAHTDICQQLLSGCRHEWNIARVGDFLRLPESTLSRISERRNERYWWLVSLCNVLTCDTLRQRSDCNWGVTCDQLCNVGSHHRTVASLPALTQNWGLNKMKGPGGLQRAALLPCNPSRPSCLSPTGHDYISSLRLCLRHAEFTSSSTRCCEVRQSWSVTANISICGAVSLDRCRLDSLTPDNLLSLISLSLSLTRK